MAFKVLCIAKSADADPKKHYNVIDTGKTTLYSTLVKNLEEALEQSRNYSDNKQIDAILLCPGFTHYEVAEIVRETKNKVSVSVARGDGPGSRIVQEAFKREGM